MRYKSPKDIKELEKLYYGNSEEAVSPSKINDYENFLRTEIISPSQEKEIKQLFEAVGKVEKIGVKNTKTADFYVKKDNGILFYLEVTSINTTLDQTIAQNGSVPINLKDANGYIESINKFIYHALEKDHENYPIVCIIFIDTIHAQLGKLSELVTNKEFVIRTDAEKVGALLFIFEKVGGNVKLPTPICYRKNIDLTSLAKLENIPIIDI